MNATKLARQLLQDDLSRADEVPVCTDGHRAYDGWLRASSDASDTDTREALEIQTGDPAGNYVLATVSEADWSDCAECDEHTARVVVADDSPEES